MRKTGRVYPQWILGLLVWFGLIAAVPAGAQFASDGFGSTRGRFGVSDSAVSFSGQFTRPDGTNPARLFIKAAIKPGWEIYSITQAPKGPTRTVIKVKPSNQFQVGDFRAATPPQKRADPLYKGLIVETHQRTAVWYAPIQFAPGVDFASLKIAGTVFAQTCEAGACLAPRDFPFVATVGQGFPLEEVARSGAFAGLHGAAVSIRVVAATAGRRPFRRTASARTRRGRRG